MKKILPLIFIFLFSSNIFASDKIKNLSDALYQNKGKEPSIIKFVDFSEIVPELLPTVVNVATTKKIVNKSSQDIEELLKSLPEGSIFGDLKNLLEKQKYSHQESYSSGSGFIISEDGYIVTNSHVIDNSDGISISMQDGKKIEAILIGSDEKTDIALLKIDVKEKLKFAKFGNSSKSKIGQWVIAVGNPFGLGGSVSSGIISAHGRDINAGQINDFIQTDAAINKGNSGGPLFNINGEVIGIATAIFSPSGGNIGIGFATPSNIAKDIVKDLKKSGSIKRGYLGVSVQKVTEDIAESINLKKADGAMVVKVFANSPASNGGILLGDVITKFNGTRITKMKELPMIVGKTPIGKKVKVEVIRGGKKKKIKIVISELGEKIKTKRKTDQNLKPNIFGMTLEKITDEIRQEYKIANNINGLIIADIENNTISQSKGLSKGDIILSANQIKLKSVKTLSKILNKSKKNKKKGVFLIIKRKENNFALVLPIK